MNAPHPILHDSCCEGDDEGTGCTCTPPKVQAPMPWMTPQSEDAEVGIVRDWAWNVANTAYAYMRAQDGGMSETALANMAGLVRREAQAALITTPIAEWTESAAQEIGNDVLNGDNCNGGCDDQYMVMLSIRHIMRKHAAKALAFSP